MLQNLIEDKWTISIGSRNGSMPLGNKPLITQTSVYPDLCLYMALLGLELKLIWEETLSQALKIQWRHLEFTGKPN